MKAPVFTFCLLIIMVTSSFANSCPDVKDAATIAIEERNTRTTDVQNAAMADPEADRSEVFS